MLALKSVRWAKRRMQGADWPAWAAVRAIVESVVGDNQLRQPILLHTHNAVVERAPLAGFPHPTQYMDNLGYDRGDGMCKF